VQWSLQKLLRVSADFWYYDFIDRIQSEGAQNLVDMWAAQGMPPSTKVEYDPVTKMVTQVFATQVNVPGSVITYGIDFGATLGIDGGTFGGSPDSFGRFNLGVQGTYTLSYTVPRARASMGQRGDCDGTDDDSRCELVGARNADTALTGSPPSLPRLKLNIPLTWSAGVHSVTAIGHVTSGVKDEVVSDPGTYSNGGKIPEWVTLDLQYGLTLEDLIGKVLTLRVGIENLLDKRPPYPNGSAVGYLADLHDPRGRMFYAKLGAEF
jgi:outer membrane receptor protein involved in Fe transport